MDLILHSLRGDAETAETLVAYLRSRFRHIRVFVSQQAMLAATMYTDTCSGSVACTERSELQRLCEQLRPDDIMVVWKLDRLGRDLRDILEFVSQLKERDVQFASVTERMNISNSLGRLVFQIFIFRSPGEFDRIRERTLAGLTAARARGCKGGRPFKLTGTALERAAQLMCEGCLPIGEIVCIIGGVSRAMFHRHPNSEGSPRRQAAA